MYLGMFTGPGGPRTICIGPLAKLCETTALLYSWAGPRLTQNMYAYSAFGFLLLSFPAQFLPAPPAVLREEREDHQFLAAGPRWAIPARVLASADLTGLPVQFRSTRFEN